MSPSTSAKIIAVLSLALGVFAFVKTQNVTKDMFDPMLTACLSKDYATMDDFVTQTGYQPYDKRVGFVVLDPFVCLITQFLYDLIQNHPAGFLMWGTTVATVSPAFITLYLEAGRQQSKGLLLWPTVLWFLFQIFGISVVYPALWVPAYVIWGNNNISTDGGSSSCVSLFRARMVFLVSLAMPIFTVLVFLVFPSDSPLWTTSAGILGGPMVSIAGLLLVTDRPPPGTTTNMSKDDAIKSFETSALAYAASGILSLLGYFYIVYTALVYYGLNPTDFLNDVWFEAVPSVKFMTIDAVVLWLGLVLHIGSRNLQRMVEVIVSLPFFGPGASAAMALASLEMDAAPQWTPTDQQKKET